MASEKSYCRTILFSAQIITLTFKAVTPVDEESLDVCSMSSGLYTERDYCLFLGSNVVNLDQNCYLPKPEAAQIKNQKAQLKNCSVGHSLTHTQKRCSPDELKSKARKNLCTSGNSVLLANAQGGVACSVRRPSIVLNTDELPQCFKDRSSKFERECSQDSLAELLQNSINPNLTFCSTDDGEVLVSKGQESCVISREEVPKSATISSYCFDLPQPSDSMASADPTEQPGQTKTTDPFSEEIHFSRILACPDIWRKQIFIKGKRVCKFRDNYYIWNENVVCYVPKKFYPSEGWSNVNLPTTHGSPNQKCSKDAFAAVTVLDVSPEYVEECAGLQKHTVNALSHQKDVIVCQTLRGYMMYFQETGRCCLLPKQHWPKYRLFLYKQCTKDMMPNEGLFEIDWDITQLQYCGHSWLHQKNSPMRQTACSYKEELILLDVNYVVLCRVHRLARPAPEKIMRLYNVCSKDQLIKPKQRLDTQNVRASTKRKAVCQLFFTGPLQPHLKLAKIVKNNVPIWVSSSNFSFFAINDVTVKTAGIIRKERAVGNSTIFKQRTVKIQAQFTVVVLTQDVEGTDFPADLARALRKNVHKFDETGTYKVDPHSIKVKEVLPAVTRSRHEFLTEHQFMILGGCAILTVVLLILIIIYIKRKTRSAATHLGWHNVRKRIR